jgi:CheY-like chemotaxis protein
VSAVQCSYSAAALARIAQHGTPSLIVLDLDTLGMDGRDFLRRAARAPALAGLTLGCLLAVPAAAAAEAEPPPCRPARPGELTLVNVAVVGAADVRSQERRLFPVRLTNRSGRMVCGLLAKVAVGGRERAARCFPDEALAVGAEGPMICTFTEASDVPSSAPARGARRRRGGAARSAAATVKLTVTGLELVEADAYKAWQTRRTAAHSQPASAPAARVGFHHVLTITRASDAKAARQELDRAIGRLRECLLARARKSPKLTVQATLRLGVSRSRGDNGESESLLAVKVLAPPLLAPEMRDCVRILDLVAVASGTDFLATAEVRYDGDGRPPPARVESEASPLKTSSPAQRQGPHQGRQGRRTGR